MSTTQVQSELADFVPAQLLEQEFSDTLIPEVARDRQLMDAVESAIQRVPTRHHLYGGDSRSAVTLAADSVHLVVTSPPYWTLKRYRDHDEQLGHVDDYEQFLGELDRVWRRCWHALVPGGRVVCVVGDVCLSRRKNNGRHVVVPLHASIQERCRAIGYDNLAPIIWHKIANAQFEAGGGGGFLGKPYEPNAVIKNDIEFILLQRKPGGYRKASKEARLLSIIPEDRHRVWFQQIWSGVTGASTKKHPAPYPVELAQRLIRMFSFVGDTVLDPFMGTGTTTVAAAKCGRNSIGIEVDPHYFDQAAMRVHSETRDLFGTAEVHLHPVDGGSQDEQ